MNVNKNSCTIFLWALSISVVLAFTRASADPTTTDDGYYLGDGSQDIGERIYEAPDGELDKIPGGYSGFSSEDDGPIDSIPRDGASPHD